MNGNALSLYTLVSERVFLRMECIPETRFFEKFFYDDTDGI
jgi:hypothetical protein